VSRQEIIELPDDSMEKIHFCPNVGRYGRYEG
jgi:hypothetical protein